MAETELDRVEYLSGAFKGLSDEKKDHILDTARSLLKIQDASICQVSEKAVSRYEREASAFLETSPA